MNLESVPSRLLRYHEEWDLIMYVCMYVCMYVSGCLRLLYLAGLMARFGSLSAVLDIPRLCHCVLLERLESRGGKSVMKWSLGVLSGRLCMRACV